MIANTAWRTRYGILLSSIEMSKSVHKKEYCYNIRKNIEADTKTMCTIPYSSQTKSNLKNCNETFKAEFLL